MKKVTASAPGKLMLFGEHAVVYGHPCIVTAVDQRMFLTAEKNNTGKFELNAPEVKVSDYLKPVGEVGKGEIPRGAQFIEIAFKNVIEAMGVSVIGLKITTNSEFKATFGFGSSSASTVCLIKAISELYGLNLSKKELFDISYKTVLDIQGKGSGFDVASAIYGGTLYFVTGGKAIEPLKVEKLPLIVGYSGVKADTVTLINKVSERFANSQESLMQIYDEVEGIVERAKECIVSEKWNQVGSLMNNNQILLTELGVSIRKLDSMVDAAKKSGAYGAKLSGAGGGDCMIAICPNGSESEIKKAIEDVGGEILSVKTNAPGVRIEK